MSDRPPSPGRRGRPKGSASFPWRALFQQTDTPVFVLGKQRRLRFANAAWERLAGTTLAAELGMVCTTRGNALKLAIAMAPPPETLAGRTAHCRRPDPTHSRTGPPWWDVTFVPLRDSDGLLGVVGFITAVGDPEPTMARKIPPVLADLRTKHAQHFTLDALAGESLAANRLQTQIRLTAMGSHPVWIRGEPGTGKETTARILHHNGLQRERGFVSLDCEGLQPYLIEGLFFGHGGLEGSGRVGTIYLKEPANLPRDLQQRLLDECNASRTGAPRLLCGAVGAVSDDVRAGRLLPAFLTDVAAFEIALPALRDRLDDFPRLLSRLLERFDPVPALEPAVVDVLRAQAWPSNVRELADVLAGAVERAGAGPIACEHLPYELRVRAGLPPATKGEAELDRDSILQEVERRLILMALRKAGQNPKRAAERLGITRAELARRAKALGIELTP